jgi:hypothetical protein
MEPVSRGCRPLRSKRLTGPDLPITLPIHRLLSPSRVSLPSTRVASRNNGPHTSFLSHASATSALALRFPSVTASIARSMSRDPSPKRIALRFGRDDRSPAHTCFSVTCCSCPSVFAAPARRLMARQREQAVPSECGNLRWVESRGP